MHGTVIGHLRRMRFSSNQFETILLPIISALVIHVFIYLFMYWTDLAYYTKTTAAEESETNITGDK